MSNRSTRQSVTRPTGQRTRSQQEERLIENRRRFGLSRRQFRERMPRKPRLPYRLRSRSVPEPPSEPEVSQVAVTRSRSRNRLQQSRAIVTPSRPLRSVTQSVQSRSRAAPSRPRSRSRSTPRAPPLPVVDNNNNENNNNSSQLQSRASTSQRPPGNKLFTSKKPPGTPEDACDFCFSTDKDFHLGPIGGLNDLKAHMFCLYFAAGLTQDPAHIQSSMFYFKDEDIRKELKRASLLKCSYCGQRGAAIGCAIKKCPVTFHMTCGIKNSAFFNYNLPNFPAYCKNHRPKTVVPNFKGTELCTICQQDMKIKDRDMMLYSKCCKSYFHRNCIEEFAYHIGRFRAKCPNCQNRESFVNQLKAAGIFIPERLSTMEMDPPQFAEPQIRFICCANECRCAEGRSHNGQNEWELFSCDRCGSQAIHIFCAGNPPGGLGEWLCDLCEYIEHDNRQAAMSTSESSTDDSDQDNTEL